MFIFVHWGFLWCGFSIAKIRWNKRIENLPGLTCTNFAFSVHEIVCWRARRIPIKARRDRNFDGFLILFKSLQIKRSSLQLLQVFLISSLSVFKVSRKTIKQKNETKCQCVCSTLLSSRTKKNSFPRCLLLCR